MNRRLVVSAFIAGWLRSSRCCGSCWCVGRGRGAQPLLSAIQHPSIPGTTASPSEVWRRLAFSPTPSPAVEQSWSWRSPESA